MQSLHLKSSTAVMKKWLMVYIPIINAVIIGSIMIATSPPSVDSMILFGGIYVFAVGSFWFFQILLVHPFTKNDILIDERGLHCSNITQYELKGVIDWQLIEAIEVISSRSTVIFIDIYPHPRTMRKHLKAIPTLPDSLFKQRIRLRINHINETATEINNFIISLKRVNVI